MARRIRSKEDDWRLVAIVISVILIIPCLIASVSYYYSYRRAYPEGENGRRVFDLKALIEPLVMGTVGLGLATASAVIALNQASTGHSWLAGFAFALTAVVAIAAAFYVVPRYWAATYFGLAVDPERDLVVFRKDPGNFGISDYLTGRAILQIGDLEVVSLSAVQRITREAGKKFFLHGAFGSRGVMFSNKQKRDEGIAAIEFARGRRLTVGELGQ